MSRDKLTGVKPFAPTELLGVATSKMLCNPRLGGPEMIRTSDTRFRKPLLYPLSYGAVASLVILLMLEIVSGCRSFAFNLHEVEVFIHDSVDFTMHHKISVIEPDCIAAEIFDGI